VFCFICNMGTANFVAGISYALEHGALFFAPYGGATVVRLDPPDRYFFNCAPAKRKRSKQSPVN
jgi:branched-chain amino acid transport system substrate-binding protein